MTHTPCSLVRTDDPVQILDRAAALMPATEWAATLYAIERMGVKSAITFDRVAVSEPVTDGPVHWFATEDDRALLEIGIAPELTDVLCAIRFGGRAAARPRAGGPSEMSIAAELAGAVVRDLASSMRWVSAPPRTHQATVVSRSLGLEGFAETPPAVIINLSGSVLASGNSNMLGDDWSERLAALVRSVRLPVRTVLARPLLSAGEVTRLSIGDVIPIRFPDRVRVYSGMRLLASGVLGEQDGHASVVIDAPTGAAA